MKLSERRCQAGKKDAFFSGSSLIIRIVKRFANIFVARQRGGNIFRDNKTLPENTESFFLE